MAEDTVYVWRDRETGEIIYAEDGPDYIKEGIKKDDLVKTLLTWLIDEYAPAQAVDAEDQLKLMKDLDINQFELCALVPITSGREKILFEEAHLEAIAIIQEDVDDEMIDSSKDYIEDPPQKAEQLPSTTSSTFWRV